MKLEGMPVGVIDWLSIPASSYPGTTGVATVRARQLGEMQLRLVSYSSGYISDHWCEKGHIVYVIAGTLTIEHKDGDCYELSSGKSYHVADNDGAPHRLSSQGGASVFIID
jgi:quercetin dioxygenase-like cupin family protein